MGQIPNLEKLMDFVGIYAFLLLYYESKGASGGWEAILEQVSFPCICRWHPILGYFIL